MTSKTQSIWTAIRKLEGTIIYEDQWNGSYVFSIGSSSSPEKLKDSTLTIFQTSSPELSSDKLYKKPNFQIMAIGESTDSPKTHQWQVNIYDCSDEIALDDMSSYLAVEFPRNIISSCNSVMVVFENSPRYDY
jgi:hypothetical protein